MPAFETTPPPDPPSLPPYDRDATLPLDPDEPEGWRDRRQVSTMMGLAALHPRDEIEIMLGVQSLCAYHAPICCHLGMNQPPPPGSGLRHFTAAAARAFDTLLRALERRQAKPLS